MDYKDYFDNSPIAFFRTRISDGQFLLANNALSELLGCNSPKELLKSQSIHFYLNPDERNEFLKEILESDIKSKEIQFSLNNGEKIWVVVSAKAYPEQDYVEGSMINISKLKEAESKISLASENLEKTQQKISNKINELALKDVSSIT